MNKHSGNIYLATILFVAIISLFISPSTAFFNSAKLDVSHPSIERLEIEFVEKDIFLNVFLSKPMTCEEISSALGVKILSIGDKRYFPSCLKVNNSLSKITYTEIGSI